MNITERPKFFCRSTGLDLPYSRGVVGLGGPASESESPAAALTLRPWPGPDMPGSATGYIKCLIKRTAGRSLGSLPHP